jgi:hypothetical protein
MQCRPFASVTSYRHLSTDLRTNDTFQFPCLSPSPSKSSDRRTQAPALKPAAEAWAPFSMFL